MVQHLLLMAVAPPLLWIGAPLLPLLRGLPTPVRRYWLAPFFRWPALRSCWERLTHPAAAWTLFIAATWIWHIPQLYELALRSDPWHYLQHACFLGTGLLFWHPVVQPYPSRPRVSRWVLLPYLLAADMQNTVLSALFAFSDRVIYPHYGAMPRLWGLTALDDQAAAGVIMWVPGSLIYLVPLAFIAPRLVFGNPSHPRRIEQTAKRYNRIALTLAGPATVPTAATPHGDLLRRPLVGSFLHWRHARTALQIPLFVLAAAVIVDGLTGPQVAPLNLAGVLPWVHWRGLIVLGLLVAGNVFCLACPFTLPRRAARRWLPEGRAWPRWLRNKWPAVGLLLVFFWAYETFSLWASPWRTAWIALAYFAAAFVIDGFFRGAAFCKYLCPIGQFHFVQSLVSPLEVRVRDAGHCRSCTTKDCIRGGDGVPGCELHLFLPRKAGNMDCTFCLDCVHACPHDNVMIAPVVPSADVQTDPHRSGVGRLSRRYDIAALVVVLVFAAFANAAGMVQPVLDWQRQFASVFGCTSARPVVTVCLLAELLLLPALLVGGAAALGRWWAHDARQWYEIAARFAYALVPLGFGMWLAHYSFHLLTSAGAAVPAFQRFAADWGLAGREMVELSGTCCARAAPWLLRLEILVLDFGLLLSLYSGYCIALAHRRAVGPALRLFAPWAALMALLFAVGIWILFQPMEMRGMVSG
jgi:hypothetical protein